MSDKKEKKEELKMVTAYKDSGKELKVNSDMIPHLKSLGLSLTKPK